MKPGLSHDEAFAELDAVAFDLLDSVERDAIMAHVATCTVCRAELDALRETAADLAFAAPASQMSSTSRGAVKQRLLSRASANVPMRARMPTPILFPPSVVPQQPQSKRTERVPAQWLAIAAGVMFVAGLGTLGWALSGRHELVSALDKQLAAVEMLRHTTDSLSDQLAGRDSLIAGVAGRDVTVMTLTSAAAKDPYARMFWDRTRHTWTLIAHNMPELKSGRTYQLWLVTSKARISAGTFAVRNGEAVVMAKYDLTDSLKAIAVTNEPAGGVPQPTTDPILVAAAATK